MDDVSSLVGLRSFVIPIYMLNFDNLQKTEEKGIVQFESPFEPISKPTLIDARMCEIKIASGQV